jgi:hypothetical protein
LAVRTVDPLRAGRLRRPDILFIRQLKQLRIRERALPARRGNLIRAAVAAVSRRSFARQKTEDGTERNGAERERRKDGGEGLMRELKRISCSRILPTSADRRAG